MDDDARAVRLELKIDSLAAGGDGVGRDADGRVTFVPRTAPGDRVEVRVVEARRTFARAEPVRVLEPSPDRVEPGCELFADARCGGCQWRHVAHPAQARAKQAIVESALRNVPDLDLRPIATPVAPDRWRRRARLHWFRGRGADRATIGFFAPRTRRVTEAPGCPQLEEPLERALAAVRAELAPALGRRGEILLVAGHQGDVHVAIEGRADPGAAERLVGRGGIAGVRLGGRRLGAPAIELEPGVPGRADEFAQASREGNAALVRAVVGAAAPLAGARVLEVFAGSGNFTRALAGAGAEEVVAVDRGPAHGALPPAVTWMRAAADRALRQLAERGERFDVVVLDPPRTGAREVMPLVAELAPRRFVYVSCDPATLARDVGTLAGAGYRPAWAQPLDLMPQTAHVEIVVAGHAGEVKS